MGLAYAYGLTHEMECWIAFRVPWARGIRVVTILDFINKNNNNSSLESPAHSCSLSCMKMC